MRERGWHSGFESERRLTILELLSINEAITILIGLMHHGLGLLCREVYPRCRKRCLELRLIDGAIAISIHLLEDFRCPGLGTSRALDCLCADLVHQGFARLLPSSVLSGDLAIRGPSVARLPHHAVQYP